MKAHTPLLLMALFFACVASKGLLLTEISRIKSELKSTMESQMTKLRERKLAVISSRRLDNGLAQTQTAPRVPRYLKPTTPRQLKDLESKKTAPQQHASKNFTKATSSPKIDRYLKPNQPRNLANNINPASNSPAVPSFKQNAKIDANNVPNLNAHSTKAFVSHQKHIVHRVNKTRHQAVVRKNVSIDLPGNPSGRQRPNEPLGSKTSLQKPLASQRLKKRYKAKKINKAKKVTKAKAKKVKAALKKKKALKSKRVVKAKRVVKSKKRKHTVKAKKSRHLNAGLNDSDNKLLEELSKKVKAAKEQAAQVSDIKSNPRNDLTAQPPARKLKKFAAPERSLLDLPSQEEFYSNIVNDYSSRF